ncbi:MAG: hypothetical protein ACRDH8_06210 [Actinomycetota bacterium]
MCWDFDYVRAKLQEDIRATRSRGRVPPLVRIIGWLSLATGAWLLGYPLLAVPTTVVFEAYVAPLFARRAREIGPLREWHPPESYRESPEAVPPTRIRP